MRPFTFNFFAIIFCIKPAAVNASNKAMLTSSLDTASSIWSNVAYSLSGNEIDKNFKPFSLEQTGIKTI